MGRIFALLVLLLECALAMRLEYVNTTQDCSYCLDDNPNNDHVFCTLDFGFGQCFAKILFKDEMCPSSKNKYQLRSSCFSMFEYNRRCT